MRIMIGLLVLSIGICGVAMLSAAQHAAQHMDRVVVEEETDVGIPSWVHFDLDNWR